MEEGSTQIVRGVLTLVIADGDVEAPARLAQDASAAIAAHDWRADAEHPGWRERLHDRLHGEEEEGDTPSEANSAEPTITDAVSAGTLDPNDY